MLKKTIKFTDYDGNQREEDWYFNLNKAEVFELEASINGGFDGFITQIINDQNGSEIMKVFKDIIKMSVGKKSLDGRKFIKNEEVQNDFLQTEAYNELFMELVTNADAAADFIKGVLPEYDENVELPEDAKKMLEKVNAPVVAAEQ